MSATTITNSASTTGTAAPASQRASALVELAIVLGVLELGMWEVCGPLDPVFRVISLPLVALIVWRSQRRRASTQLDGPAGQRDSAARAWRKTALVTLALAACILPLALLLRMEGDGFRWFWLEKGTRGLVSYLAEKGAFIVVQQLLLQYFLWPCCAELVPFRRPARWLAALLFGFVHLPSVVLTGITTVAAFCWIALFARGRRIAPLAVSHLALAVLAHAALPERWTLNMRVGAPAQQIVERYRTPLAAPWTTSFRTLCSDQYYATCGATPDGFIRGLYRDLLGRPEPATDGEVAAWHKKLAAHARTDIVVEFFNSSEFLENVQHDRNTAAALLAGRLAKQTSTPHQGWR